MRPGWTIMQIAVFSTKPYDRQFLAAANARYGYELHFLEPRLTAETARLGEGFPAVCAFVTDLPRPPCARDAGGRRYATGGAALRRLQQCRSPCRRGAGGRGRPR